MGLFDSIGKVLFGGKPVTDSSSEIDKKTKEKLKQTGTQTQIGSQTGTRDTTQVSTDVSKEAGTIGSTQESRQTGTQTGTTTGTTSTFSKEAMATLERALSTSGGVSSDMASLLAGQAGGFDPAAFIAQNVGSARTLIDQRMNQDVGALSSSIGGTPATNTMAALLSSRMAGEGAAQLAGVEASATAQAMNILNSLAQGAVNAEGAGAQQLATIAAALKGGETVGTQTSTGTTTQTGSTAGQEVRDITRSGETVQVGQEQMTQQALEQMILDMLTKGTTKEKGTTTGTEVGGGGRGLFGVLEGLGNAVSSVAGGYTAGRNAVLGN